MTVDTRISPRSARELLRGIREALACLHSPGKRIAPPDDTALGSNPHADAARLGLSQLCEMSAAQPNATLGLKLSGAKI